MEGIMNTKIASAIAIIAVLAMVVAVIPSVDGTDETETVLPTEGDLVSVTMDGSTFTNDTFDGSGTMTEAIAAINASVSGQPDHNNHFVISVNQSFSTTGFTVGSSATTDGTVDVILNVNGYHLEVTSGATVSSGSSLTINGGTNSENTNGSMSKQMASALITNHGNLTLNNVDVTGTNTLFYQNRSGSVGVINGGTIYSSNVAYDLDNGELTILSGSVTAQYPAVRMDAGKLTIGEQDSDSTTDPYVGRLSTNSNSINFYSGYVTDVTSSVHFPSDSILEGTFGLIIDANIPPGTYISGTSGSYRVERLTEENAGAMIESMGSATQYFSSIGSASSFMEDGDKLTLLESYTGPSLTFDIYTGVIDLNGNSITITDGQYGIYINASNRTPSGSQQVQIINSSDTGSTISATTPINVRTGNTMNTIELQLDEGITLSASGTSGSIVLGSGTYAIYRDDMRQMFVMGAFISEKGGVQYISGSLGTSYDLDDDNEIKMINNYDGVLLFQTPGNYILDLGNNKVDSDSDYGISIAENGVHVTIRNGTVNVDRNNNDAVDVIAVQVGIPPSEAPGTTQRTYDDLSLTLENVNITTDGYWGIDTNGNNTDITVELIDSSVKSSGHGIYFPATGSLTIQDSDVSGGVTGIEIRRGSLEITGSSEITGGTTPSTSTPEEASGGTAIQGAAVAIAPYSSTTPISVNIAGGTFNGAYGLYENDVILAGLGDSSISITGGVFYGTTAPVTIADIDATTSEPILTEFIKGGSYYTGTSDSSTPATSLSSYLATGYSLDINGENAGSVNLTDPDGAVAELDNGAQFTTLQLALDAAVDGQTITLLKSVEFNGARLGNITKDITLDLNDKTITIIDTGTSNVGLWFTGCKARVTNGTIIDNRQAAENASVFTIYAAGSGTCVEIDDIRIQLTNSVLSGSYSMAAQVAQYATMEIGDGFVVTATGSIQSGSGGSIGVMIQGQSGTGTELTTLRVSGTANIHVNGFSISGNGTSGFSPTLIEVSGGTFLSDNAPAVYHPQIGTMNVTGGSFTGTTGIEIRSGELNILNNPTFTATGEFSCTPNGNGATTSGAAVAVIQHTTAEAISVDISGGTFVGEYALYESNPQENEDDEINTIRISVTNGNFNGETTDVNLVDFDKLDEDSGIRGGTFTTDVDEYLEPGFELVENPDGTYSPQTVVLALTESTVYLFETGSTYTIETSGDYDWTGLSYSSSNESVATVADGTITAVGDGTATITVTFGNQSATISVTVESYHVGDYMSLDPITGSEMEAIESRADAVVGVPQSAIDSEAAFILDIVPEGVNPGDTYLISLPFSYFSDEINEDNRSSYTFYGIHFLDSGYEVLEPNVTSQGVHFTVSSLSPFLFSYLPNDEVPVQVTVNVLPEDAVVTITGMGVTITAHDDEMVELVPGDYIATAVADGYEVDPIGFSIEVGSDPVGLSIVMTAVEPDDPGVINPPIFDDDDDYVPPIYVPSDTSSSDDDTVKIVACAAAAVVAAIMAAFLILGHRRE